jgi:hypothetical protein
VPHETELELHLATSRAGGVQACGASHPGGSGDDFSGLRHLAQRLGDDFTVGLVLYTGQQTLSFGPRLRAMPVSAIWEVPTVSRPAEDLEVLAGLGGPEAAGV